MKILQRITLFLLFFLIGNLFVSLCDSTKNHSNNLQQSSIVNSRNTFSNFPKLAKCFDLLSELEERKLELTKESENLADWLDKNDNVSGKRKSGKTKEILLKRDEIWELSIRIDSLKSGIEFRKEYSEKTGVVTNLLGRENCYEF